MIAPVLGSGSAPAWIIFVARPKGEFLSILIEIVFYN
jgi:hypothetical protein